MGSQVIIEDNTSKPGRWGQNRWPLRKKLMIRFTSITLLAQIFIYVFTVINMSIISNTTEDKLDSKLNESYIDWYSNMGPTNNN